MQNSKLKTPRPRQAKPGTVWNLAKRGGQNYNSKLEIYWKFLTKTGFTLIELLVVISIIALLIGLSTFALQGARKSSRDTRRKSDLELIRSGIEIFKADCDVYPSSLPSSGSALNGDGSTSTCLVSNTYISSVPSDPLDPNRTFYYTSPDGETYELCAALEGGGGDTCAGSCGETCNYQRVNP